MLSHEYKFHPADLFRVLMPTLLVCCALLAALKLGARFRLLPPAAAALDPNSTVLAHQARAASSPNPARILLIGDSTCLVGVDAAALSRELGNKTEVLNLALLSWFDLRDYGQLAAQFADDNPGQVKAIVLLVTPVKLAMRRDQRQEAYWEEIRRSAQPHCSSQLHPDATDRFGLRVLRQNLLGHLLATPLRGTGPGAALFGFSSEVDAFMSLHRGTWLDLGTLVRPKVATQRAWRFAQDLESQSEGLRSEVPSGVKLIAGFTPVAHDYSQPKDRERALQTLQKWNRWLRADLLITNLPTSLPDVLYASKAHLNAAGQERFTAILASELRRLLPRKAAGAYASGTPNAGLQSRSQKP